MFWAKVWKLPEFFIWKFSFFLADKFSIYLNRRVFVMSMYKKEKNKSVIFLKLRPLNQLTVLFLKFYRTGYAWLFFPPCFTRETTFVTSYFLYWPQSLFWKWVISKRKEFTSQKGKKLLPSNIYSGLYWCVKLIPQPNKLRDMCIKMQSWVVWK